MRAGLVLSLFQVETDSRRKEADEALQSGRRMRMGFEREGQEVRRRKGSVVNIFRHEKCPLGGTQLSRQNENGQFKNKQFTVSTKIMKCFEYRPMCKGLVCPSRYISWNQCAIE